MLNTQVRPATEDVNASFSQFKQQRIREIVKRLVIDLGYLENLKEKNLSLEVAIAGFDTAIECLNEYANSESD